MTKLKFPAHQLSAFKSAKEQFAKDGFVYVTSEPRKCPTGGMEVDMDATEQQIFSFGVKMGAILMTED